MFTIGLSVFSLCARPPGVNRADRRGAQSKRSGIHPGGLGPPTGSTDKLAPIVGKTTGGGTGSKSLSYYLYSGNSESKPYSEIQHSLGTGKTSDRDHRTGRRHLDPPRTHL